MKRLLTILAFFLFGTVALAQTTTVTGTVTDAASQAYAYGTWEAHLVGPPGYTGNFYYNGTQLGPSDIRHSGSLNSSGAMGSTTFYANNYVTINGGQKYVTTWLWTVCSGASSGCYTINLTITGATYSISSNINPPAITVGATINNQQAAYADSEIVGATLGYAYFNLTDGTLHICSAPACTWVDLGGSSFTGFNVITSGTNTAAAMVVGSGASLGTSGSGTIAATTAAALASTPSNCGAGVAATGVGANGNAVGCFTPSGGSTPASPGNALQLANAGATALATASASGFALAVDSVTLPTQLSVPFSEAVAGPRPVIDVTNPIYGAKGDGGTDDTAAITAAIAASCATKTGDGLFAMHPDVFFPPGVYRVQQPQTPSTAAVFPLPANCSFLQFRGGAGGSAVQFGNPAAQITVINGASPNNAAIFQANNGNNSISFKDISTQGYNQAIYVNNTNHVKFDNAPMTVSITGQTDNTPLKVTNMLEVYRVNQSNCLFEGSTTTLPPVIYTVEAGVQPFLSFILTKDVTDAGGAEQAIIRAAFSGGTAINEMIFRDTQVEDTSNGYLTITNTSGTSGQGLGPFVFDRVTIEDAGGPSPILTLNDSTSILGSVYMNDVNYGLALGPVVSILAGRMEGFNCFGPQCQVVDANGNATGQGRGTEQYGAMDHVSDNSFEIAAATSGMWNGGPTLADRWCASGGLFCNIGIDPAFGVLFGLGDTNSFNAGLFQTTKETLDVQFAKVLPPTSFSGSGTTGGSLPTGTYYAQIYTSAGGTCDRTFSTTSAPSYATGVMVVGSNTAINFVWTLPVTTPSTPSGYCIEVQTTPIVSSSIINTAIFVTGSSTTSFLYTGQSQTSLTPIPAANQMVSEHRFTENALGINTLTPAYDIDVVHTTATNSGIRVPNIVDSALTPSTSPICPNGTNGAFTTVGCSGGGGGASIFTSYQFGNQTAITGTNNYLQTTYPSILTTTQTGSGTSGSPFVDAITLTTQNANAVFAGPTSGSAAIPTFRALVSADIVNNAANTTGNAATATKWASPITIAGTSVDGSANVSLANGFWVKGTSDSGLSNAFFMGSLSTGILKVTTTTGIPSNATNADVIALWTGSCSSTTFLRGDGACAGSSGGPGTGTQYGMAYWLTSTTLGNTTPPSVQGQYDCGYTVPSSSTVAPTCPQVGVTVRAITGTTNSDIILYSDNAEDVNYQGSVAVAVSLPSPTTLNDPSFVTRLINNTSGAATAVTVTAASLTFQSTGSSTLVIPQGQQCLLKVDPSNSVWDNTCSDLPLIAGANITLTRGRFGVTISSSGGGGGGSVNTCSTVGALGTYATTTTIGCGNADFVYTADTLAGGANSIFDMSASTASNPLRIPSQAGETSNGTSSIAYDTTAKNMHVPANGADAINLAIAAAPTNGHLAGFSVSGGTVLAVDSNLIYANVLTDGGTVLTSGVIPQACGATCLENSTPQLDNGLTTASTLTYAGTGGLAIPNGQISSGSNTPICSPGTGGGLCMTEGTLSVPVAGQDHLVSDSAYHTPMMSVNGGAFFGVQINQITVQTGPSYTASVNDATIVCNASTQIDTLPTTGIPDGKTYRFKNWSGGTCTLSAGGLVNIDGSSTAVLTVQYASIDVIWSATLGTYLIY